MIKHYKQSFQRYSEEQRNVIVQALEYGHEIIWNEPILTTRTIVESSVVGNATNVKHEQSRVINIIGRFISNLFTTKEFEVKTTGTLDGVKYRIAFGRGGLTENERATLDDNIRNISFYVSRRYDQVYHLDYCR